MAIAQLAGDPGFYLYYLDSSQNELTDTYHSTIEQAEKQASFEFGVEIANDEGITELDQHVLSNHSFGSHNVNATYISQHIDHLATCAEKIDAGITRRIQGTHPVKRKAKRLRAVP